MRKVLESLGLKRAEAAIYLALLRKGEQNLAALAGEAKVHRPVAYTALPRLIAKGLVAESPHGKRIYYRAESPRKLVTLMHELEKEFRETMPLLEKYARRRPGRSIVRHLSGAEGIRTVYDDVVDSLKRGDTFLRYSTARGQKPKFKYVARDYERRRDAKQLQRLVITNAKTGARKGKNLNRFLKVIPAEAELFEYDVTQLIYGKKIAFVDYNTESATVIENPAIARFQEHLFRFVYSKL